MYYLSLEQINKIVKLRKSRHSIIVIAKTVICSTDDVIFVLNRFAPNLVDAFPSITFRHNKCPNCAGFKKKESKHCRICLFELRHKDAQDRALEKLDEWVEIHGELPKQRDWVSRHKVPGKWPYASTIRQLFGTWEAFISNRSEKNNNETEEI